MTLNEFIDYVLGIQAQEQFLLGSIRQYTPDVRLYRPTRRQVEVLAPYMRKDWAQGVYKGYIGHQIIYGPPRTHLRTVLSVGLASATLVRVSSYQPRNWHFQYYFPTQYITLTDTITG